MKYKVGKLYKVIGGKHSLWRADTTMVDNYYCEPNPRLIGVYLGPDNIFLYIGEKLWANDATPLYKILLKDRVCYAMLEYHTIIEL
jgi:hypothetical protein